MLPGTSCHPDFTGTCQSRAGRRRSRPALRSGRSSDISISLQTLISEEEDPTHGKSSATTDDAVHERPYIRKARMGPGLSDGGAIDRTSTTSACGTRPGQRNHTIPAPHQSADRALDTDCRGSWALRSDQPRSPPWNRRPARIQRSAQSTSTLACEATPMTRPSPWTRPAAETAPSWLICRVDSVASTTGSDRRSIHRASRASHRA